MPISRGCTPTHTFSVPVDLTSAVALYVTYQQLGRTVIEKTLADCTVTANAIVTRLTQKETLRFAETPPVKIQIRAKLVDGSAHKSNVIVTTADELLKSGEI